MKFSESWLREWVNPSVSTIELSEQLTMAGLEVDAIEAVAGAFSGVVVGEIVKAEQHPDADKLRVCEVLGPDNATFSVVCGAANARVGIKIPFAMIGAKLPGDFKIKKAKLRGVESFGMLCGQTELEAGDDDSGLWELPADAPVGQDLRDYLNLNDTVIEVDLTPNRSDCLGIQGIAREVGVLNRVAVTIPDMPKPEVSLSDTPTIHIHAPEACPVYCGRIIKGLDITKASPLWLQEKLRRSGIRPIDAVVDVTNYVLLELGQPMHAFDLDTLSDTRSGDLYVRYANSDEKLALLNDQEISLKEDTLIIATGNEPVALAGIMGGSSTAVSPTTQNILLEVAFFQPISIAGKARNYGLHTDSSHRFERGVDFAKAEQAMDRATQLLLEIVGGEAGPITTVTNQEHLPDLRSITLHKKHIESGLGFALDDKDTVEILTRLGLTLIEHNNDAWQFSVPSYRFDIAIEADLLEELARVYGYNNLPTTTCMMPQRLPSQSETSLGIDALDRCLLARDFQEVITYSFIDPKLQADFFGDAHAVELLNPISADLSVMRTSLIPGLVSTLVKNVNRQHDRVRIYEKGLRFLSRAREDQSQGIAGLIYGQSTEKSWFNDQRQVDFYDIKGDVEALLALGNQCVSFIPSDRYRFMHPGQTALVHVNDIEIGFVGALHPELAKQQGLAKDVFVFELDVAAVSTSAAPSYTPISRYPEVERDLAFSVPLAITAAEMLAEIEATAGDYLKNLKVFDIYTGEGIDSERKSAAFHLTFQHSSRTLNEDEINTAIENVVKSLKGKFSAILRQ